MDIEYFSSRERDRHHLKDVDLVPAIDDDVGDDVQRLQLANFDARRQSYCVH
ncbi:hypothetical protein [Trinickia dabaoshanensis]|uniref:hypothetical protein n=1 Tax=Trinickia dabaoshanensis TaxID=564714 RepID=UPI001304C32C|nr:hypothetical protein [Trinickia dabaoshanensis]